LQELRGTYGIKAPAPICADDASTPLGTGRVDATCQVVQAPSSPGARLVPDVLGQGADANPDGEIRLTYRELSTLIEDAIRSLR
jgi:hypothetical protein